MARTKEGWSYSTGERGRNRVRAFERKGGLLMLEYKDGGKRTRLSLGHRDRARAKQQADGAAADLLKVQPTQQPALTLGVLFDIYGTEVTPRKSERSRAHDKTASKMFAKYFGADRVVSTLGLRDFERFIKDRLAGRVAPIPAIRKGRRKPGPVAPRTVERDLRFLSAAFNWATMAGDGQGGALLERNPVRGLKMPREKNPKRVMVSEAEYQALVAVAGKINPLLRPLLMLANETGHRIGAIRQLRWSDIDLEKGLIRWRAATEKTGYEHVTPMTEEAGKALRELMGLNPGIGEAPVFPEPKDPSKPLSRHLPKAWWDRAEKLAGLDRKHGRGFHSLRRKFASDLMHQPLKVLSELGGWKAPQTILMCYQHPDQDQLREALHDRRRVKVAM